MLYVNVVTICWGFGRHKFNIGGDDKIKPNNNMKKKVTVRTLSGECVGNFINTTSQLIMYSASVQ